MSVHTTIKFSRDNVTNTALLDAQTDAVLYEVKTELDTSSKRMVTVITNSEGRKIASSEWREHLPDLVNIVGMDKSFSVDAWLSKSILPFNYTVKFNHAGSKLKWKDYGPGMEMQLFDAVDKTSPIAAFKRTHKASDDPARLLLIDRAVAIMDIVVISFLLLEKTRRMKETNSQNLDGKMMAFAAPGN